ncbi:MAG: DUF1232 domain-containing protein [Clostridiales bacterium]|nr:DUF1232 domain-containing protein [Clostridiales bacterium]
MRIQAIKSEIYLFGRSLWTNPQIKGASAKANSGCRGTISRAQTQRWAIIGITVCHALQPIDLMPDFIPASGFLDDVLLLSPLIVLAIKPIPNQILAEYREQAKNVWENGKSKRFLHALPIIAIWLVTIGIIVKAIWF